VARNHKRNAVSTRNCLTGQPAWEHPVRVNKIEGSSYPNGSSPQRRDKSWDLCDERRVFSEIRNDSANSKRKSLPAMNPILDPLDRNSITGFTYKRIRSCRCDDCHFHPT
jgi:hypothetical protein